MDERHDAGFSRVGRNVALAGRAGFAIVVGALAMTAVPAPARASGNCSFVTVTGVAFGAYDVFAGGPLDSVGSIGFRCNPGAAGSTVVVTLSEGNSGGFLQRDMRAGTERLAYNLFLDPTRTTVWGDGSGGSSALTVTLAPSGWTTISQSVYGRIPAGQNAAPGAYVDTITVTMNW